MEAIQSLTRTINVFVNFFQSINCLFLQVRWLENNCQGESPAKFFMVIFVLSFCVVYVVLCDTMDKCSDPNSNYIMSLLVYSILISILGYFLYKRYRDANPVTIENNAENRNESAPKPATLEDERETLINNTPIPPMAIAMPVPVVEMTNLTPIRDKRLAAFERKRYESV